MPHDALEQLLRKADATATAPPPLTGLPARVRRRRQRRRMTKALAAAGVAIIALPLLAMTLFTRPSPPPSVAINNPAPETPTPTRRDLARLNLQADLHEETAAQLLAATAAAAAHSVPAPAVADDNVLAHVREQRDRAALILIYEADQAAREKKTTRALAAYRRTIELFPKTYAAAVARQRLKEMPT